MDRLVLKNILTDSERKDVLKYALPRLIDGDELHKVPGNHVGRYPGKQTEANLIKEHKPRYNVFLKDDKTFPYIRVTNEPYPRVEIIRQKNLTKDNHNYFGPYTDAGYLREVLRVLHKIFPIRTCTYYIDDKSISSQKIKICLDYHIKRCDGPCEGLVSKAYY